jgi:AdoMet-dependent rRNA methyltransferase SPB1
LSRKLESARKKAEGVSENLDMTDKERSSTIKSIYKRAGLLGKKKPEVKYIVAKKGTRGRTLAKSKGIKGPYKVVDGRMKKDTYNQRKIMKKSKNKKRK